MTIISSEGFQKRIYNVHGFQADIDHALQNMGQFRAAHRSGRVDKAFAERIMLAVTQVNGCRYCEFGHAHAALQAGVSQEEIRQLVSGDWHDLPEEQIPALLFAQHYAETAGQPALQALERLTEIYGEATAQDIQAHIRMISMGNLLGNTFDALLSRLAGKPARESNLWQEIAVLLSIFIVPFRALFSAFNPSI